nr:peroxiredoxin-4-like isoform X3 [Pocillopora verrucosa]
MVTFESFSAQFLNQNLDHWEGTAVVNGEFKYLKMTDSRGKYLVFFFYPLDFTFVCPTEIIAFSDRIEEFRAINTEVVGCSVDSVFTHLAWINTPRKEGGLGRLKYPLLSDLNHQIAKDYGVLLENEGHTLRGRVPVLVNHFQASQSEHTKSTIHLCVLLPWIKISSFEHLTGIILLHCWLSHHIVKKNV